MLPFDLHLVEAGRLTPAALERARQLAGESGERLGAVLTRLGLISERELADSLAGFTGLPLVASGEFPAVPILERDLAAKFLKRARLVPLEERPDGVVLAMADPLDDDAAESVAFALERPIIRRIACATDLEAAWERLYGSVEGPTAPAADKRDESGNDDAERLKDLASEAPVIRLVNQLITRAVERRASDIHIEPMPDRLRIRYRIDGVLEEIEPPPRRLGPAIVSRVKIMAKLNIAERRLAQDGRIRVAVRGQDIDLRVATNPAIHGEGVVLRILDRGGLELDFAALGFDAGLINQMDTHLARPHGIILVTGPTGSGKTTTLYTALLGLNTAERKLLTIEDPVEYQLDGVNQVQVMPQIGRSFATALRGFLRQDPDVMMIGEIRDLETAEIAVQAALTGHLILSTLHTNNAASAITRLLDMGVEDYLLTSTLTAVLGQRLVRTLCPHCRRPHAALPELVERLGLDRLTAARPVMLWEAPGCTECGGSGFKGRTTLIEILPVSDAIRQLTLKRGESGAIERQAIQDGMRTMRDHGLMKALEGLTSVAEVLRATEESEA